MAGSCKLKREVVKDSLSQWYSGKELEDKVTAYMKAESDAVQAAEAKEMNEVTPEYTKYDVDKSIPQFDPTKVITDSLELANMKVRDQMDSAGSRLVEMAGVPIGKGNKWLEKEFPVYADARDYIHGVWKGNSSVASIRRYMDVMAKNYDKDTYNELKSTTHVLEQEAITEDNTLALKLEKEVYKDYGVKKGSKEAAELMSYLNNVVAKSGLYSLGTTGELQSLADGTELEVLIAEVEGKLTEEQIAGAKELAELYIDGKQDVSLINPLGVAVRGTADYVNVEKLATMYSLQKIDGSVQTIRDGVGKHGAFMKLYEAAVANAMTMKLVQEAYPYEDAKIKGNYIMDIESDGSRELKVINQQQVRAGIVNEKEGWKLITEPTDGQSGLMARHSTGTLQSGLGGVNSTLASSDKVLVMKDDAEVVKSGLPEIGRTDSGRPMVLRAFTNEEKRLLGHADNVVQSLVRTRSHNKFVLETQEIRKAMTSKMYKVQSEHDILKLHAVVMSKDVENPWMLDTNEIPDTLSDAAKGMLAEITNEYDALKGNQRITITELDGLKKSATYIRNDMADGLVGYRSNFFKSYNANRNVDIFKRFIVQQKIYQIILNIPKIGVDAISGMTYISTLGVGFGEMAKGYSEIPEELKKFAKLREDVLELQAAVDGGDKSKEDELTEAKSKVNTHRFAGPMYKGLLQSMSTDITLKNFDSISGLDADETRILSKLTRRDDGDINKAGEAILKFAKAGPEFQNALKAIGEAGKGSLAIQQVLREAAENIQAKKDEGDVEGYLKEFIGAPSSEAVKLGSALTHWSDVIPRIIGFEHNVRKLTREFKLKNKRVPNKAEIDRIEEDAAAEVRQGLGDYLDNAPQLVHELSSVFVLMYPSFWLRMQKVLWNLGVKHPVSMLGVMLGAWGFGTGGLHIFDTNIAHKFDTGTLFNNPANTNLSGPFENIFG